MIETFTVKATSSFALWFDHMLLDNLRAYSNVTSSLKYKKDDRLQGINTAYSSPLKQWVYDSSVTGAIIPSSVTVDGSSVDRDGGLSIDFDNGRALFGSSFGTNRTVSASYAVKDLNVYLVENASLDVLFENTYQLNSRYDMIEERPVEPYDYVMPACFIMLNFSDIEGFALGGERKTKLKFRVIIMTENSYHLDGCMSLFRDLVEVNIPVLSGKDTPFNERGDLKGGEFNYLNVVANSQNHMFLDEVRGSKIVNVHERKQTPDIQRGILDFYVSAVRTRGVD